MFRKYDVDVKKHAQYGGSSGSEVARWLRLISSNHHCLTKVPCVPSINTVPRIDKTLQTKIKIADSRTDRQTDGQI